MISFARIDLDDDRFQYRPFADWCRENGLLPETAEPGCATFRTGGVRVDFDGHVDGVGGSARKSVYVSAERRGGEIQRLAQVAVALAGRFGGHVETSLDVRTVLRRALTGETIPSAFTSAA